MREGVVGLLRDKTRPSRLPPLAQGTIDRVVELTASEPPHEATRWTASAMAAAVGTSPSSVLRVWRAHKLRPHRVRTFKLSRATAGSVSARITSPWRVADTCPEPAAFGQGSAALSER